MAENVGRPLFRPLATSPFVLPVCSDSSSVGMSKCAESPSWLPTVPAPWRDRVLGEGKPVLLTAPMTLLTAQGRGPLRCPHLHSQAILQGSDQVT